MPSLCVDYLRELLGDRYDVRVYDTVSSTNTLAREAALSGAHEGTVILACAQTGGRGRMGRSFFSPADTGLYLSILLRPTHETQPLYITTAAAVSVAEAVEDVAGVDASIKWVNDVYCRGKKVCGILTEGAYSNGRLQYAVLGIGINVFEPEGGFPPDIETRAGAVFDAKTPRPAHPKEELAAALITRFWRYYEALGDKTCLSPYRRYDFLTGKRVQVLDQTGTVRDTVTVLGISDEFGLLVQTAAGQQITLASGEVSLQL